MPEQTISVYGQTYTLGDDGRYYNAYGQPAPTYAQNVTGYDPSNSDPNRPIYDYNETQFADDPTAQYWANRLGGQVQNADYQFFERSEPERLINFGGNTSLNAGLVADTEARYGTPGIDQADYQIARDRGYATGQPINQSYDAWARSQPGFVEDPTLSNTRAPAGANYDPYRRVTDPNTGVSYFDYSRPQAIPQSAIQAGQQTATPYRSATPTTTQQRSPVLSYEQWKAQQGGGATSSGTVDRTNDRAGRTSTSGRQSAIGGSQRGIDTAGSLSQPTGPLQIEGLRPDVNDSYSGTTTVNGQPMRIAVTSTGSIYNDQGQDITSQIEPGERSFIIGSFAQQANNPAFQPGNLPQNRVNREPIDSRGQTEEQQLEAYRRYVAEQQAQQQPPSGGGEPGPPPPPSGGTQPPPSTGQPVGRGYPYPTSGATPPNSGYGGSQSGAQNLRYNFIGQGNGDYVPNSGVRPFYSNSGEDIQYRAENDRNLAIGRGEALDEDLRNYTRYNYGQAADYEDRLNTAFDPIARGEGGYSNEEKDAILNNPYLQSLQQTEGEAASNYLTDEEAEGIRGNPREALEQLGRDEAGMDLGRLERSQRVRDSLSAGETNLRGALDSQDANLRGAVGNESANLRATLGGMAQNVRGAYGDAAANVRDALNYGEESANQFLDRDRLGLSADYLRDYQFGARDQQDIIDRAGRSVGQQNQADEDRLLRDASAAGNTSPLALEAARSRLRQSGAQTAAGALQDARISAKRLGLDVAQNRENTRLGAEQNYANLGTNTQLSLGGRRVAAEQALGEQAQGNERYLGDAALQTEGQIGAAQRGVEQYLGSQRTEAEKGLGAARTGAEQELGAANMAQDQWKTGTNLGAFQAADKAASDRAAQVAGNRQATNQYNQGQRFTRGQYIYGQGSAANQRFADTRLGQEQQYRDYLGQGKQTANENVSVGNQQRIGAYGAQMGAQSAATGNAIRNYAVPGLGEKIAGFLADGGVIQGPRNAIVGEAGRELVVDLEKLPRYGGGAIVGDPEGFTNGMDPQDTPYTYMPQELPGERRVNPLYAAIKKGMYAAGYDGGAAPGDDYQRPSGGGFIQKGLGIASLFGLAEGGVVAPQREQVAPGVQLVDGPQVMELGRYGAQAVVPLTRRPENKVNVEDIPYLAAKYGSYVSGAHCAR